MYADIFCIGIKVTYSTHLTENVMSGKRSQIERLQERAAQELRLHVDDAYPDTPERFTRLLLKLPTLKALQPQVRSSLWSPFIIAFNFHHLVVLCHNHPRCLTIHGLAPPMVMEMSQIRWAVLLTSQTYHHILSLHVISYCILKCSRAGDATLSHVFSLR